VEVFVGWTGMASASSLAHFNNASNSAEKGMETIEIDPQFAQGIGLNANDIVRAL
jgi:peroxin-1